MKQIEIRDSMEVILSACNEIEMYVKNKDYADALESLEMIRTEAKSWSK